MKRSPYTQSRTWTIRLLQGLWWLLTVISIVHVLASLPILFEQTNNSCFYTGCLTPDSVQALKTVDLSAHTVAIFFVALNLIFFTVCVLVSVFLFWRSGYERMALYAAFTLMTFGATAFIKTDSIALQFTLWGYVVTIVAFLGQAFFFLFFYLFPDGHFVPRWTRPLAVLLVGLIFCLYFLPNVAALHWFFSGVSLWATFFILAGVIAQVYRYRVVSNDTQKQQTKWVAFVLISTIVVYQIGNLSNFLFHAQLLLLSLLSDTAASLGLIGIPLSIGVAILRYRLWNVDLLINRTVVYVTLTTCIVGIYALIVGILAVLFQASNNLIISFLAAASIAIIIQPLRTQLQQSVNRLMYGERDDPYTVLARLEQRLQVALAPERVLHTIVETVAQALKLPYAAISMQPQLQTATYGVLDEERKEQLLRIPLQAHTTRVGEMLLAPRGTHAGWTRADQRLLREFAHQAALTVYAIGLTDQLQRVNMDLQRSREGLVVAREEERRRLRRDLHDGLAPTLAALALTTSTLGEIIPREPELAIEITHELEQAMRGTIGDIRRLVYDLRPPTLDELGLVAAIREYIAQQTGFSTRSGWQRTETTQLQVILESNETLPTLPAAVEVAAYRIVQEALMNVVRHARATSCRITITLADRLQIAVCDDGIGLPAEHRTGVGLLSMRERAEELGGTCTIERSESGTCVHAQLPIARKGNE